MTASLSKLKTEIAKPDYTMTSDSDVATAFHVPGSGVDIQHNINVGALEKYLAAEGALITLRDEASSVSPSSASAAGVAQEVVALIDSANVGTFNIHHPRAQAGLTMLVNASLLTAAQHIAITALGITQQTIWQQIGMPNGTADNVMRARAL